MKTIRWYFLVAVRLVLSSYVWVGKVARHGCSSGSSLAFAFSVAWFGWLVQLH